MSVDEAEGFVDLGLYEEAWGTLDNLEPEQRTLPEVIRLRIQCAVGLERWSMVQTLADHLSCGADKDREAAGRAYLLLAIVSTRVRKIEAAKEFVRLAIQAWPKLRVEIIDDPLLSEHLL